MLRHTAWCALLTAFAAAALANIAASAELVVHRTPATVAGVSRSAKTRVSPAAATEAAKIAAAKFQAWHSMPDLFSAPSVSINSAGH